MSATNTSVKLDLDDLVVALSEALGLVGGKIVDHGKRVTHIALSLVGAFNPSPREYQDLRYAALLHDAGVSRTRIFEKLIQLDWDGAIDHCRSGSTLLGHYPGFENASKMVLHHHDQWSTLTPDEQNDRALILANLIFLADRIDFLIDWKREVVLSRERIERSVRELAGTFFNPRAVDAFLRASGVEVFWLSLMPRHLPRALDRLRPAIKTYIELDELEVIAGIFAGIVDNKSFFTHGHSHGVSRLCHHFGTVLGIEPITVQKLRIAGLLHDLGKLAVPDEIQEKPDTLTAEEFQIVKRHPFETYYVLSGMPALSDIRDWAAFHHERIDGSGYPFHLNGQSFTMEHLVVMVAEIIQALIQDRPYREGLGKEQVLDILNHLTCHQPVFGSLMDIIYQDYEIIEKVAKGSCING